jgi:hypothetical protein
MSLIDMFLMLTYDAGRNTVKCCCTVNKNGNSTIKQNK